MKTGLIYIILLLLVFKTAIEDVSAEAELQESTGPVAEALTDNPELWYFRRDNCFFCSQAEEWLLELQSDHPMLIIHRMDVIRDMAGRELFQSMMTDRGRQATAVPAFILDERVWVGFTPQLAADMTREIHRRLDNVTGQTDGRGSLISGFAGAVNLAERSMLSATLLIAFVDGFNPCSIWVLTVLLAMIISSRSRIRIAAVGLTFLVVTAAIYGLFITGLFNALQISQHLGWLQVAVALLALTVGLVNIKDYFAYKIGLSFTIPERFKPRIYQSGRAIREDRPLIFTLAITALLATGVAVVELPCTAGFPVIWTSLLTETGVGHTVFAWLLALYLLVYLSIEIGILIIVLVTLRANRVQEQHGRILKLFGGMIMIALALILLIEPAIMESLTGSLLVIGSAILLSLLILVVHRARTKA
jgi:MFS family permease